MGRNHTGPPCSVGHPTVHALGGRPGGGRPPTRPADGLTARGKRYRRHTTTDDDDRHQQPLLVWPPYTMCRRELRDSNKTTNYPQIILNYPVASRSKTLLLVLSLKFVSHVILLLSYALFTGSESLNASNTSSSHLPTKFSQLPNLHTFISSSPFNVLAVLALHPSLLLLGHLHHPL